MTIQEKQRYLSGYRAAGKAVRRQKEELRRREQEAGAGKDPGENRLGELRRELASCLERQERLGQEIGAAADRLADPVLSQLIRKRYLECRTWEEVAGELNYDSRWVYRLHRRALEELTVGR